MCVCFRAARLKPVPSVLWMTLRRRERRDIRALLFITGEPLVRTQTLSLAVVRDFYFILIFYWPHTRSPPSQWYWSCGWVEVISTAARPVSLNPLSRWLTRTAVVFLLTLLIRGVHVVTRGHTHTHVLTRCLDKFANLEVMYLVNILIGQLYYLHFSLSLSVWE